jgi:hypothetical protein
VGHKNHARNQALQTCESIQRDYPEPISLKSACLKKITIRIALRLKTLRRKHQIVILSKLEKVRAFPHVTFTSNILCQNPFWLPVLQ